MSIKRLPREFGLIVCCNGAPATNEVPFPPGCEERHQTAAILAKNVRAWLKKEQGWGRGLRAGHKRKDHCPTHLAEEKILFAKEQADRETRKRELDEKRKAKFSAAPKPKKKRSPAASSTATPSPSEASAPAPA